MREIVKAKHLLNAQLGQTSKQNICKIPRSGKRQNKRRRPFRGRGNAKTNGGGLSAVGETPKQTAADLLRV